MKYKKKEWNVYVIYTNDDGDYEEDEYQISLIQLLADYLTGDFKYPV